MVLEVSREVLEVSRKVLEVSKMVLEVSRMKLWKLEMLHMFLVQDQMKTHTGSLQSWLQMSNRTFLSYC